MRRFLLLFAALMPSPVKLVVYRLMGWKIGRNVRIGMSYLGAEHVVIGDGVRIGHLNIFKGIRRLRIGRGTFIANANHFFGAAFYDLSWQSELTLGEDIKFMSRHFVDVGGTITIGDRATIGGRDSHFWSHSLTLVSNREHLAPGALAIGADVYVGARATLVTCAVPAGAVIAAGAVVVKSYPAEAARLLIAGNPAIICKRYSVEEAA